MVANMAPNSPCDIAPPTCVKELSAGFPSTDTIFYCSLCSKNVRSATTVGAGCHSSWPSESVHRWIDSVQMKSGRERVYSRDRTAVACQTSCSSANEGGGGETIPGGGSGGSRSEE